MQSFVKPYILLSLVFFGLSLLAPIRVHGQELPSEIVEHDLTFAAKQLEASVKVLKPNAYPLITNAAGDWNTTGANSWTSGFFPATLWLMYQYSGDSIWRKNAEKWQMPLTSQSERTDTHDLGFIVFNSFGNGYRLTGSDTYRKTILQAAASVATRYNPNVGCIKSWDRPGSDFKVIIDNMMNLELLFWAAKHGGDPKWYDMAVSHALKTRANHVRADGSTYHLVNYNPNNGTVRSRVTVQGYSDESTWSRGQAWAIYGFTMTYRETGDVRFLETARAAADYFINHLPSDSVPYWDFQAPNIPNEPRDSSAAAVAASGLLELSTLETNSTRAQYYFTAAYTILTSLSSNSYLAEGTSTKAILLHGTQHKPAGLYDTGTIWGDYYLLEALLRFSNTKSSTLSGRVVDNMTGLGIAGAEVTTTGKVKITDANGAYIIEALLPSTYTVRVIAAGYEPTEQTVSLPGSSSVIIDFALSPQQVTIEGVVRDTASGQPISGATVSYSHGSATTDLLGQYQLSNVRPGFYNFFISANGYISKTVQIEVKNEDNITANFSLERSKGFSAKTHSTWLPIATNLDLR